LNKGFALASCTSGSPCHGLSSSVHSCHSQRTRSAVPTCCRFGMPRPPRSRGLQTVSQLTRQAEPVGQRTRTHVHSCLSNFRAHGYLMDKI
jgi:hypothetical protein